MSKSVLQRWPRCSPSSCLSSRPRTQSQNHVHLLTRSPPHPFCLKRRASDFRDLRIVRSTTQEDFAQTEQTVKSAPSVLKLPVEPKEAPREAPKDGADSDAASGIRELIQTGTIKEVFQAATKAVADAPAERAGQAVLYGGLAAFGLLVSGAVISSLDSFPLLPEALETVGIAYSALLAGQVLRKRAVSFPPPSPFKAVVELVDIGQSQAGSISLKLPTEVREEKSVLGDSAPGQLELAKAEEKIAVLLAEKEALEAVALQLANERDSALSEVSALKDAIHAMTNRIKGIEEMLEQELKQLKQQNLALETVSLQLAAERDVAVQEREELRNSGSSELPIEEKEALETTAIELVQEREEALAEVEELRKVVAILRESMSTASEFSSEGEGEVLRERMSTASGLPFEEGEVALRAPDSFS